MTNTVSTYDFNKSFPPLKVLRQSSDDCFAESLATMACAFMRVYESGLHNWDDSQVTWDWDSNGDLTVTTPVGPRRGHSSENEGDYFVQRGLDPHTFAGADHVLRRNAIIQLSVPCRAHTFADCYKRFPATLPVVDSKPANGNTELNHSIVGVGVRPKGLLVQNSWGPKWGKQGRAILTWDFLKDYGCHLLPYTWGDNPIDGLSI